MKGGRFLKYIVTNVREFVKLTETLKKKRKQTRKESKYMKKGKPNKSRIRCSKKKTKNLTETWALKI
jgi:hypothetical protein